MNQNIETLAGELKSLQTKKKDFIINPRDIKMHEGTISIGVGHGYNLTDVFHENLISKLQIPAQYYKRMKAETPDLLDQSVNAWMAKQTENVLVRTYKHEDHFVARAMLSNRYKAIDNYDVLFAALDAVKKFCKQNGVNVDIDDCGLTERRMYVRLNCPDITVEANDLLKDYRNPLTGITNPFIKTGIQITNSEVGQGAFQIAPRAIILACKNGMTRSMDNMRSVHLGGKNDEESEIKWSEETQKANLDLIVSQVKDAVKEFLSKEYLQKLVNFYTNKGLAELQHPNIAMQNAISQLGYSEERRENILDFFTKSKDFTRFGAMQALTFEAHQLDNDDLMFEAEKNALIVFDNISTFDKSKLN